MNLIKCYTLLIVLYPFLYAYATPIPSLSVGDLLLMILICPLTFDFIKNRSYNMKRDLSKFWLFVSFFTLVQMLCIGYFNSLGTLLFPTVRLVVYFLTIAIYSKKYFDFQYGLKVYRMAAVISSVFLVIQMIGVEVFHRYIPGSIPGLPLLNENVEKFNQMMLSGDLGHRVRSFFSEPSYFAIYVILYLAIELLILKKKSWISISIISLALLLSGSGTAILLFAFVYLLYILQNFKTFKKKTILIFFSSAICILLMAPIYMKTEAFQTFYTRTFVEKDSTEGRFGTYDDIFKNQEASIEEILIGRGIEKIDVYIAGIPRIYYYYGAIGLLFFGIASVYYLFKLSGINRISLILLIVLSFATEMLFSYMILLYGTFMFCKEGVVL